MTTIADDTKQIRQRKRRKIYLGIFLLTSISYGAFIVHKFVQVTSIDESELPADASPVDVQNAFYSPNDTLGDKEYVQAANYADAQLLGKVREKYRPKQYNLGNPRSRWQKSVHELEALVESEQPETFHDDSSGTRELERLQRVKGDKPSFN